MAQIDRLVARSSELKAELLAFAQSKRFASTLDEALQGSFTTSAPTESDLIDFFENFIMERRFSDGRTLLERFVRARGDLPRAERDMLLGWMNKVDGIFEVERIDGEVIVAVNVLDDLTYRIRSNMGLAGFDYRIKPGIFVMTRIVPILNEWILSGVSSTFEPKDADRALAIATQRAAQNPNLVFRNPELLAAAWDSQRKDRAEFIEFFGSDVRVLSGTECVDQMREFRYSQHGDAAAAIWGDLSFLASADSVGLIYDDAHGLGFFTGFHQIQEAFQDPELAAKPEHADAIQDYVSNPTISPVPLRRCAEEWPDGADRIFARLLGNPKFSWAEDGEALLRVAKPEYFDPPPKPKMSVNTSRIAAYIKSHGIPWVDPGH